MILKGKYSNKSEKLGKGQKSDKSFGSCGSCVEAAGKGYQQGQEGPEKGKGRKPEGKGPVILLMHCRHYKRFTNETYHCQNQNTFML